MFTCFKIHTSSRDKGSSIQICDCLQSSLLINSKGLGHCCCTKRKDRLSHVTVTAMCLTTYLHPHSIRSIYSQLLGRLLHPFYPFFSLSVAWEETVNCWTCDICKPKTQAKNKFLVLKAWPQGHWWQWWLDQGLKLLMTAAYISRKQEGEETGDNRTPSNMCVPSNLP